MVTKYEFRCPVCGEQFLVHGHWWNQWTLHHYLDCKYYLHCMKKRHGYWQLRDVGKCVRMFFLWFLILPLQLLDIVLEPFRRLFS